MPRCKNCGAELNQGDTACAYCGTRVETPAPAAPPVMQDDADEDVPEFQTFVEEVRRASVMLSKVRLINPRGELKTAPVGYSWTTLIFGPFVCLCRRDWVRAVVWFVLWFVCLEFTDPNDVTAWDCAVFVSHVVMSFIYNKMYIRSLCAKGYRPLGEDDAYTLRQKGII